MPSSLQCHGCRHYAWGWLDSDRCSAFLDGIPDDIWLGNADHAVPFPGDGGVHRESQDPGPARNLEARHAAWRRRAVERFSHEADALGAIVAAADRGPPVATVDPATLRTAWQTTDDAPAMLLVLLRAGRTGALANALRLTSSQLEAEGCDFLDDKGWLGVGLCLGSYQSESSFGNVRAAWSALSSPFGDGYLTTRVQQLLVRNIRRVVPDPPDGAEWTSTDGPAAVIGPLDDRVVAMRLTPRKQLVHAEDITLLEPWTAVTNAQGLESELARELVPGHRLYGRARLEAVARRTDSEDVLFANDTLAAVVHLTWAKEPEPALPTVEMFASLEDWMARRMNPDHDEFAGQAPRAFAFEFRSTLTLEEMKDRLPDSARWEWTVRDSAWYGDYLWAKDGSTRLRIFAKDERFAVQADLVDPDDRGKDWFGATKSMVVDSFLPAIEASDVVETTPEDD